MGIINNKKQICSAQNIKPSLKYLGKPRISSEAMIFIAIIDSDITKHQIDTDITN